MAVAPMVIQSVRESTLSVATILVHGVIVHGAIVHDPIVLVALVGRIVELVVVGVTTGFR